jgi:hypothetical protein
MIKHNFYVNVSDVNFDENFNDNVFAMIIFYFVTTQEIDGEIKSVRTLHQIDLPNPDANNFIACKDVSMEIKRQWVEAAIKPIEQNLIDVNLEELAKL